MIGLTTPLRDWPPAWRWVAWGIGGLILGVPVVGQSTSQGRLPEMDQLLQTLLGALPFLTAYAAVVFSLGIMRGILTLLLMGGLASFFLVLWFTPLLDGGKCGNETAPEKSLRTIVDAEANFWKADPDRDGKNFAYNLKNLHDTKDAAGNMISYIDGVLASGQKEGYYFGTLCTYDAYGHGDREHGFAYYAVPIAYKDCGRKSYIVNQKGIIYYKDQGDNRPPAAWPENPLREGWHRLDE